MATRVLVICVGIILRVNSSYCIFESCCVHQTTLPIEYDKTELSDIISYNSGKVFEVFRNQCLDITLTKVSPQFISCMTIDQVYVGNYSSSAVIQLLNISDTMDGVLKCDLFVQSTNVQTNKIVIALYFGLKVMDARRINVMVNNMQLHFKTKNLTTDNYDGIAVYEFEEDAYIDLVCNNLNNISTSLLMHIHSNPGHQHRLETALSGAAVRATGWLTADDENNVYIDCISHSNTDELRNLKFRITFKLKQNKSDTAIKNHIITYVNDEPLTHKRMDLENNKLQYEYVFDYNEVVSVSCIRKYSNDTGLLVFSYIRQVKVAANERVAMNNDDMTIVHHSSAKILLKIRGNVITKEQSVTCSIKDKPWLQAEIILIPKAGARQRICSFPADSGRCQTYAIKWFFNVDYGSCSKFYYGGCGGNENQFSSQKECADICVNPSPRDACWLPKIKGPCISNEYRWYFNTTMKQCMPFQYGGCLGNTNNFMTEELCERQCDPDRTVETTTENIPFHEETTTINAADEKNRNQTDKETTAENITIHEEATTIKAVDGQTRNQTENNARDEVKIVETGGSTVVVACVAVIVAVTVGASCIAFWYRRKKNIRTPQNENTNQSFEDVDLTPRPQNPLPIDSSTATATYDYAYNINIDRLFVSSGPPDPCRRVKPIGSQQEQRRASEDSSSSESNYYCEIDDYFINKREAKKEQKQKKKNLLKK